MPLTQDDRVKYKVLYLQTAREYVKALHDNIVALEKGNPSPDAVEVIHRSAHSLKSQSAMMDYTQMAAISLAIENIFAQYKESEEGVSDDVVQTVHSAIKQTAYCLKSIEKDDKESDLAKDTQKLRKFVKHIS